MEVNENKKLVGMDHAARPVYQRPAVNIPSVKINQEPEEPVTVSVHGEKPLAEPAAVRSRLNQVINVVNVASEATVAIRDLVTGIDKLVENAAHAPENSVQELESRANSMVDQIKQVARTTEVNGVRPLYGDKVALEIQEKIGRTLEIIFPDDAKNAFGMEGGIRFSRKDAIIQIRATVESAWRRLEELSSAVEKGSAAVREAAATVDVAMQNANAADASPRDLDNALKLVSETTFDIAKQPVSAVNSAGNLGQQVLELLK